jgi:hypothetical protein
MFVFSQQKVPQSSDPRSCVYDDNTVARCSDFDTGGITAITVIIAPRDWYGTPGAPAANQHAILSLSEVLTFDRLSFLPRHKGKGNHTPKGRQYAKNKRFRQNTSKIGAFKSRLLELAGKYPLCSFMSRTNLLWDSAEVHGAW